MTILPCDITGNLRHPADYEPRACSDCDCTGLVDCEDCDGIGRHVCGDDCRAESHDCDDCDDCDGTGDVPCDKCDGDGSMGAAALIAEEANRIWRRDIGRGVTTGTRDLYIDFAKASYAAGELTPKEQAA